MLIAFPLHTLCQFAVYEGMCLCAIWLPSSTQTSATGTFNSIIEAHEDMLGCQKVVFEWWTDSAKCDIWHDKSLLREDWKIKLNIGLALVYHFLIETRTENKIKRQTYCWPYTQVLNNGLEFGISTL